MQARTSRGEHSQVRYSSRRPEHSEHDRRAGDTEGPSAAARIVAARARMSVRRKGFRIAALGALGLLALTACSGGREDLSVGPGKGWPSAFHDSRNSATSPVSGSRHLTLGWSRPVGGPVMSATTVGSEGQLFLTTRTGNDCTGNPGITGSVFSFQMPTGRKRFCNVLGPDAIATTSAVDSASNVYLGDNGGVNSFTQVGQPRWRTPVAGVPVSVQFTGDGRVLTVSQLGQVDVLDRQTGDRIAATFQVLGEPDYMKLPDLPRPPDGQGIDDCAFGWPHCPVANVSAVDQASGRFYLTVWRPGSATASLVALRYADKTIREDWSADLLTDGSATSPTLSADGKTVYVGDNAGRLLAVDAADGHRKWAQPLGFSPMGAISLSGGLLIPGGDDGHLVALRDHGDSVDIAWERKDLQLRGRPVQTAGDTGYVVAAIGSGLNLVTFDTRTGATVASAVLPDAQGTTVGTAIGAEGEVVVTTRIGEVYAFKPEK